MQILMITPSFHPALGGVETHVLRVSQCLAQRGHDVSVLTHSDSPSRQQLGPLTVHHLRRSNLLAAWTASRPHIAAADVVHCHDAYSFLHFYLPSCLLPPRRPVFATFHGYEGYPIQREALRRRQFVRRRVLNAICMGEFICRRYDTACYGISYGAADPIPQPPPLPPRHSALFLGRLADDTSIMLYLEALVTLRQDYNRRLPLTVAGEGPLRPLAERYAEAQGVSVKFLGAVADPAPLFAECDLAFVSGYLAIWQALAMNRLVFAVHENDLKRDYLRCFPESNRVMVTAGRAAELAAELNHYLGDDKLGDGLRARGARLAADHTWDRVADLYLDMYRSHGVT